MAEADARETPVIGVQLEESKTRIQNRNRVVGITDSHSY